MKHYSKKLNVFLYICVALFVYSCSQENDFIKEQNHSKLKFEQKTFEEVLKIPIFNEAYRKITKSKSVFNESAEARTALEDQYGFTIVENSPVRITTDENGSVFYTLLIERDVKENLKFENLMIQVKDDETAAAIFKYIMSEKGTKSQTGEYFFKDAVSSEFIDLNVEGKMFFSSNSDGDTCITTTQLMCNATWSGEPYDHIANYNCWVHAAEYGLSSLYNTSSTVCYGDGGGGSTDGGTSSNNTGGHGASDVSGNGSLFIPTIPCKTGNCIEADSIKTPCEEIKAYYLKPEPMLYSSNLLTKLNLQNESGFYANIRYSTSAQAFVSHYAEVGLEDCYNNRIIWPSIKSLYWLDHTHTINGDAYLIPSFLDLHSLYKIRSNFNVPNYTPNDNMFTVAMTVAGFKYVIKIENYEVLKNKFMGLTNSQISRLDSQLNRQMPDTPSSAEPDEMATKFLIFCENYGISLYRKAANEVWNKLKLNSSKTNIEEEPCTN